ncbi:MAG: TetR/AcrR family transcriptional regulator [Clostridia bacterium]|nr:TetR/AcrR family transcriptional regulator [Clostridia bacterium]
MDRRTARTHKLIRKAYFDLIREKHSIKISISEIARRADIDRKTFYLHFNSVEDVLNEYIEERFDLILSSMEQDENFNDPFNVGHLLTLVDSSQKEEVEFLKLISKSDAYDVFWNRVREKLTEMAVETYSELTDLGEEEIRVHADFFGFGALNIYRGWLRGDYDITLLELVKMVSDVAHNGLYRYMGV